MNREGERQLPTESRTTLWRTKRRRLQRAIQQSQTEFEQSDVDYAEEVNEIASCGDLPSPEPEVNTEQVESGDNAPSSHCEIDSQMEEVNNESVRSCDSTSASGNHSVIDRQPNKDHDDSDSEYDMLLNLGNRPAPVVDGDGESDFEEAQDTDAVGHEGLNPDNPPDDPGGPEDPGNGDSDSSEDSAGESPNFNCDRLHQIVLQRPVRPITVKEAVLLKLALALRHGWSYECLLDSFKADNVIFGHNYFPCYKQQLWKVLNRNEKGVRFIAYCSTDDCGLYLGEKKRLPERRIVCPAGHETQKGKEKCFVVLDLKSQLKRILSIPGVRDALKYRENRPRDDVNNIEDIFDGASYKRLQEAGVICPLDFTLVLNTDGFKVSKNCKTKAWPIFLRLSELKPSLRQKTMILAGLWIGRKDPVMNTFLRPIVDNLNSVSQTGVTWKPDGHEEVTSKFFLIRTSFDSMARAPVYNMLTPTGYQACIFCKCVGIHIEGCVRYTLPEENEPSPELRTDASLRQNMIDAHTSHQVVEGVKGPTELMNVQGYDLVKGSSPDDLHTVFEGDVRHHTDLLLTAVGTMSTAEKVRTIDQRLGEVKPPKNVSRAACSISLRAQWKGSEWRNWLFYYSVPCLQGLIPQRYLDHLAMLAHAIYLLSQESIRPADIDVAEELLKRYVALFEEYFGREHMRFNVHLLLHFAEGVRYGGPLWASTTFHFESWNFKLIKFVKSAVAAEHQIITKYLMKSFVELAAFDETVPQEVKQQIEEIMHHRERKRVRQVGQVYLLGSGQRRVCSDEEGASLEREGIQRQQGTTFYKRVIFGESQYRSKHYPKGQHDNSLLYTTQDTFCTVESVVVLEEDGMCGMFVTEHDVDVMVPARYIGVQKPAHHDLHHFITINVVKCPAVKVRVHNKTYMMPLANRFEID